MSDLPPIAARVALYRAEAERLRSEAGLPSTDEPKRKVLLIAAGQYEKLAGILEGGSASPA